MRKYAIILGLLCTACGVACKRMLDVDPPGTNLTEAQLFKNETSALQYLSNTYASLVSNYWQYTALPLSIYADELLPTARSSPYAEYASGFLSVDNRINQNTWKSLYSLIYFANWWLTKETNQAGFSENFRNQLTGEFLFIRAYAYLQLTQLYGPVPMVLGIDPVENASSGRTSIQTVLHQAKSDLQKSAELLNFNYPTADRVRPNRFAVFVLLARLNLLMENWPEAQHLADQIISSNYYQLSGITDVFLSGSTETIWQWWNANGINEKANLILPSNSSAPGFILTNRVLNLFDETDIRQQQWIRSIVTDNIPYFYPYKYQNSRTSRRIANEYRIEMRLAEVYLIKAEALLHQKKTEPAIIELNLLRNRAHLEKISTGISLDSAWYFWWRERQRELFTEGTHRYFDLKRHSMLKRWLAPFKPAWKEGADLLPIPIQEIHLNPALIQNTGY